MRRRRGFSSRFTRSATRRCARRSTRSSSRSKANPTRRTAIASSTPRSRRRTASSEWRRSKIVATLQPQFVTSDTWTARPDRPARGRRGRTRSSRCSARACRDAVERLPGRAARRVRRDRRRGRPARVVARRRRWARRRRLRAYCLGSAYAATSRRSTSGRWSRESWRISWCCPTTRRAWTPGRSAPCGRRRFTSPGGLSSLPPERAFHRRRSRRLRGCAGRRGQRPNPASPFARPVLCDYCDPAVNLLDSKPSPIASGRARPAGDDDIHHPRRLAGCVAGFVAGPVAGGRAASSGAPSRGFVGAAGVITHQREGFQHLAHAEAAALIRLYETTMRLASGASASLNLPSRTRQ